MNVDWSKSPLIPRSELLAWNFLAASDLGSGNPVASIPDWSGNNRVIATTSDYPDLSNGVLNGEDGVYFDGTKKPLKYTGALTPKQIFIVAAIQTTTFGGNNGLLSGLTTAGLLAGNGAGTSRFYNFSYAASGYSFRKNDVVLAETNQLAPVGGKFAVIELRFPAGIALDGFQIGQDRASTDRKLNGVFIENQMFGEINPIFETTQIYQYFARRYHIFQEDAAGRKIFPFYPDNPRSRASGRTFFKSKPYSGPSKTLLRGGRGYQFDASFSDRRQSEVNAAEAFHAEHYGIKDFVFRDWKFDPPKDTVAEFTSELKDEGSVGRFFNYSFSAATKN